MYCSHCGNPIAGTAEAEEHAAEEAAGAAVDVAEELSSADVRIAEINAQRDIRLAEIERGIVKTEVEAAAEADAVKSEILDEVLTPPEPEPVPVVVEEAPAEEVPSEEPPPVVEASEEPAGKRSSNPWW